MPLLPCHALISGQPRGGRNSTASLAVQTPHLGKTQIWQAYVAASTVWCWLVVLNSPQATVVFKQSHETGTLAGRGADRQ